MEPDLITQKTIRKILKKNYFIEESSFTKAIKKININYINKVNWTPVIITIFILTILLFLYNEHCKRKQKQAEQMQIDEEMDIINSKSEYNDDFKSKLNDESESYKKITIVTNNP